MMRCDHQLDLRRLLTDRHICVDGNVVDTVFRCFTRDDSDPFMLGIQKVCIQHCVWTLKKFTGSSL